MGKSQPRTLGCLWKPPGRGSFGTYSEDQNYWRCPLGTPELSGGGVSLRLSSLQNFFIVLNLDPREKAVV